MLTGLVEDAVERQTVTQVGLDLGFGSASNFIRAFRAATGVTPARYFAARSG